MELILIVLVAALLLGIVGVGLNLASDNGPGLILSSIAILLSGIGLFILSMAGAFA